jgi:hypothetical protein
MEGKKLQGRKKKDTEKINCFFFFGFVFCLFVFGCFLGLFLFFFVFLGLFFFFFSFVVFVLFFWGGFVSFKFFVFVFSFPYLAAIPPRLDPIDGGEIRQLHANPQEEPLDF